MKPRRSSPQKPQQPRNGQPQKPARTGRRHASVKVRSLESLAERYDLRPPDELVGPKSSQYFLDYGPPVVLADSTRPSRRAESERAMWKNLLAGGPGQGTKPS